MKEVSFIILGLFILVGLAYSPLKNARFNYNSSSSSVSGTYDESTEIADQLRDAEYQIEELSENIEQAVEESRRSPYYGKIRMSNISGLHQNNPDEEYIELYTDLSRNEMVKITGWYLKSEITGYFATIGKAALLPFPFTKTESDIILRDRDRVYLTKGFSPIGISFRTNKCTGYFEEDRTFIPSLPMECPDPSEEKLPRFSSSLDAEEECLDVIDRIPRCTTVGNDFTRDLPDTVPLSCKTYIKEQISYNTCIANHYGDTDFPGNEYRVYLGKFGPLWRTRTDKINLHDQNGLIVDSVSY